MNRLNGTETFILFELAGHTCGVRSQAVQSVEMVEHVTAVPNTASFVEGITFMRGQVIPCINLRIRFGFSEAPTDPKARMLVIRPKGRTAGVRVDRVKEFVSIRAAAIQVPGKVEHSGNPGIIDRFVEGIATIGKRIVLILNFDEVLEEA